MKKSSLLAISLIIAATFSFSGCSFDSLLINKDKSKGVVAEADKKTDTEKTDDEKFEADKKAAEEKASAENKTAALAEKQTLLYKNEKLGFSLMLFDGWKDKYTVTETPTSVSFNFKPATALKNKPKGYGRIFTIEMNADKNMIVDNSTWVKANGKEYLIGMPTDVTYEPADPEFETFKKMSIQVEKIKTTFKEYKATKQTSTTPDAQVTAEKFYGTWTIKKVAATGKTTTFNATQQKQLIGKKFTFSATGAQSFGDTMNSVGKAIDKPNYKKTDLTLDKFKQSQPTAYPKLGLKGKTISEVKVLDSNGAYQSSFYIKDDKTLLLYGGGVFFEMSKN